VIRSGDSWSSPVEEPPATRRWREVVEILEVLALALAAVATAWSGYQAARGDGHQDVVTPIG
jgi:hypothetical protein